MLFFSWGYFCWCYYFVVGGGSTTAVIAAGAAGFARVGVGAVDRLAHRHAAELFHPQHGAWAVGSGDRSVVRHRARHGAGRAAHHRRGTAEFESRAVVEPVDAGSLR